MAIALCRWPKQYLSNIYVYIQRAVTWLNIQRISLLQSYSQKEKSNLCYINMRVVHMLGRSRVMVEGDARVVIYCMRKGMRGAWRYHSQIMHIRRLARQLKILLCWVSRRGIHVGNLFWQIKGLSLLVLRFPPFLLGWLWAASMSFWLEGIAFGCISLH